MGKYVTPLEALRARYSCPESMPLVPKHYTNDEPTGWCAGDNRNMFADCLNDDTKVVIDGGSFMGQSAWHMSKCAKNATIIAIDHWQGSIEHQKNYKEILPVIYETFLVNLWDLRDRLIPVRSSSIEGMTEVASLGIVPDLVYIDWSHDVKSVEDDVSCAISLFPDSIICGDDWTWSNVREGVRLAVSRFPGFNIQSFNTCWKLVKN